MQFAVKDKLIFIQYFLWKFKKLQNVKIITKICLKNYKAEIICNWIVFVIWWQGVYNHNIVIKGGGIMRKNVILSLILTVCVVVLSFASVKTDVIHSTDVSNKIDKVLTVAKNENSKNPVLETRFLNMLNHNFVYNDDFYSDSALIENSLLALLDVAEDSYVAEQYVKDYAFNMYGKIYDDFETDKEGYVYIAPRGYTIYKHEIVSVTDNKDGSFTVVTDVICDYEDGSVETLKAETLFLEADDSAFGYNILYSDIIEEVVVSTDC